MTYGDVICGTVVETPSPGAEDVGSIPGWGTEIPYAAGYGQKLKRILVDKGNAVL